ncbi:MAG: DUF1573 domain-containing protein [Bacteroidota bacterium]
MKSTKFILLATLATTLLWSCGSPNEGKEEAISPEVVNNNASADPAATPTSGLPVFEFETDNHEFGVITEGEKVSYTFKFKNTGNAPLVISNASASCGCTVPEYTKTPVAPGEEGEVNVTFDSSGKSGMTTKSVTLIANTEPNTKVLKVSADIQAKKQ